MATDSFTFNGKHSLKDMGLYTEIISRPVFAEPKTIYDDIPGTDGEIDFSQSNPKERLCFKPRIIELECHFAGDGESRSSYMEKPSVFAEWLAANGTNTLIFDNEPNFVYFASAANLFNIEGITDFSGTFPLVFKCDPFRYSKDQISLNGYNLINVLNCGYYCDFCISVLGTSSTGFKIQNRNHPEKILNINYPLSTTDIIEVDMGNMAVTHNGISILHKCDGDFFELEPGDNLIEVTADGSSVSTLVTFRERYL